MMTGNPSDIKPEQIKPRHMSSGEHEVELRVPYNTRTLHLRIIFDSPAAPSQPRPSQTALPLHFYQQSFTAPGI